MPSLNDRDMLRRKAEEFEGASLREILAWAWENYGERAAIGTSFQGAGLVAMHTAYASGFRFPVSSSPYRSIWIPPKTPNSPLSKQQRLAQREAILLQQEKGELTVEQARAALAKLDGPSVIRG